MVEQVRVASDRHRHLLRHPVDHSHRTVQMAEAVTGHVRHEPSALFHLRPLALPGGQKAHRAKTARRSLRLLAFGWARITHPGTGPQGPRRWAPWRTGWGDASPIAAGTWRGGMPTS